MKHEDTYFKPRPLLDPAFPLLADLIVPSECDFRQ